MLDDLVSEYNTTYHNTTRMTPLDASKEKNEVEVWEDSFRDEDIHDKTLKKSYKFKIGDTVRISRIKGIFEYGCLPNWSEQVYKLNRLIIHPL